MKEFWNRQKMLWALIFSVSVLPFNGCVYVVVGSIGAFGGYVASPDTVEGTVLNYDYAAVWDKTVEVASMMGMIEERNDTGGVLKTRIQGADVKIMLFHLGSDSVKISVKARAGIFPKIKIAQDVYVKIVSAFDVQ